MLVLTLIRLAKFASGQRQQGGHQEGILLFVTTGGLKSVISQ